MLIFGNGLSSESLIEGRASHNTFIQMIYQMGVLGAIILTIWMMFYIKTLVGINSGSADKTVLLIITIAIFAPWMSLDMMFFDEFFLMPVYYACGVIYISNMNYRKDF